MQKQAFSLLELVMIVAVVAIAAGLFLPILVHAQENATRVSCIDKLKRISSAAFLYVNNNNDYTVPHIAGKTKGWPLVLIQGDSTLTQDFFRCPDDNITRSNNAVPISYSLNIGHIWNCRQTPTNRKEWGPASILSGASIMMSKIPQPGDTVWFFENHDANNSFRQMWNSGDRSLWTTYTINGFHDNSTVNNMIFMDGSVNGTFKSSWVKGDNRGIIFKDIHTPQNCIPNMP